MGVIAYAELETGMGPLLVAASSRGLVMVALPAERRGEAVDRLRDLGEPREDRTGVADHLAALGAYFEGAARQVEVPLGWSLMPSGFRREALEALTEVPYGEVVSYAELAGRAGRPRAVRAAGTACATNVLPIVVPCHRVIRSDGTLGNYGGNTPLKARLLRHEGVPVTGNPPRVPSFAVM